MSTIISTAPPATRAEALARRAVSMIVLATAALVVVIAIAGFHGQSSTGPLDWKGDAQLFTHPTIPGDRVLTGTLRNSSTHTMRIDIGDVRVLDVRRRDRPVDARVPADVRQVAVGGRPRARSRSRTPSCCARAGSRCSRRARKCRSRSPGTDKDGTPARVDYGDGSLTIPG